MLDPTDSRGESCRDPRGVAVDTVVGGVESLPFRSVEPLFEPLELLLFETVFEPLEVVFEPEESVRSEIMKLGLAPSADSRAKGSILSILLRLAS